MLYGEKYGESRVTLYGYRSLLNIIRKRLSVNAHFTGKGIMANIKENVKKAVFK